MCVIKWVMRSFSGPLGRATGRCSWELASEYLYAKTDDWVFPSTKKEGKTPLSASVGGRRIRFVMPYGQKSQTQ
jgi:hypothetical protein